MRYTMVTAVTNIVLSIALFMVIKHVGCALATSIAGWVNVLLLTVTLRREKFLKPQSGFSKRLTGMLLASVLMGAGVWFLAQVVSEWVMGDYGLVIRLSVLSGIVVFGIVLYFALVLALKVTSLSELKAGFRRG